MPWCPKCKNEYVEGVRTCADCGCELTDSLEELEKEGLIFGSEEEMEELLAFFSCNGIKSGDLRFDEKEDLYELFIASDEKVRASRYLQVFQKEKNLKAQKEPSVQEEPYLPEYEDETGAEAFSDREEEEQEKESTVSGPVYEAASQKAENFRSGAYTLLVAGIAGMILLICIYAEILPIRFTGTMRYLTGGVMGALFLLFIVMGILSLKSSRKFEGKAKEESALKEELRRWCDENITAPGVDSAIPDLPEAEEARYFKRTEQIRSMIANNFLNLEAGYLENFVDEIYPDIFGEDTDV
nr:hypothetical protein [uncultured Eisenbergiella sp.]